MMLACLRMSCNLFSPIRLNFIILLFFYFIVLWIYRQTKLFPTWWTFYQNQSTSSRRLSGPSWFLIRFPYSRQKENGWVSTVLFTVTDELANILLSVLFFPLIMFVPLYFSLLPARFLTSNFYHSITTMLL